MDIALLKLMPRNDPHTPHLEILDPCEKLRNGFWRWEIRITSTVTAGIVSAKARDLGTSGIQLYSNRRSGKPRKQRRRSGKHSWGFNRNQHYDFYDRFLWVLLYRLI
jgi:hypothetical protein